MLHSTGGVSQVYPVGQKSLSLPINETLRFDHPGVYRVYALAELSKGTDLSSYRDSELIPIISDPVTITIDPITPEIERKTIAGALADLPPVGTDIAKGWNEVTVEGLSRLRYLQTPAARPEGMKLMARSDLSMEPGMALLSAPDPEHEGVLLL